MIVAQDQRQLYSAVLFLDNLDKTGWISILAKLCVNTYLD